MMTGFDDFHFSGGLVGVPWFDEPEGESDGSRCCVTKKVRRLLGRATEFVATTADGTGRLGDRGGLWGGERHGLVIMAHNYSQNRKPRVPFWVPLWKTQGKRDCSAAITQAMTDLSLSFLITPQLQLSAPRNTVL